MATAIADLRTELRSRLGQRGTTNLTNARLDFCLKHGIIQLSSPSVHRHATLERTASFSTVSGTDSYSLTTIAGQAVEDIWTIFDVKDTTTINDRRLRPVGRQFMREIVKSNGVPLIYSRWGDNLELDPIPNGIYTLDVDYYGYPRFTLSGGDLVGNSPLREAYDEGVLLASEYRAWSNVLQDPRRGILAKAQLADWMDTIISPTEGDLDDQEDTLKPDLDGLQGSGR